MPKKPRLKLVDKLHRAFVIGCLGLTAATVIDIGYVAWQYFLYIRPSRKAEKLRLEQEMLREGAPEGQQMPT